MMQSSNHELDRIINEAGDNHHVAGAEPDWNKMQALLDIHMPVKKEPRRRIFILLAIALLMLGGAAYFLLNKNDNSTFSENKTQPGSRPSAQNTAAITTTTQNTNDSLQADVPNPAPLVQQQAITNAPVYRLNSNAYKILKGKRKITIASNTANDIADNEPDKKSSSATLDDAANNSTELIKAKSPSALITKTASPTDDSTATATIGNEVAIAKNKSLPDNASSAPATKKKTNKAQGRRPFEIALVYAPEITTVGFNYIDKPGSNYGLLLGYQVSKNIMVQTGVIKSRKNYTAMGKDYNLGYPQTASHKLAKVAGYCEMYEIPLNIKSSLRRGKKLNIFYTAGISSYIMKGEYYTFHYATTNGYYDKKMEYSSQKNYWFSVAALSIGFEKMISPNLCVAVAPFTKIPLRGMGTGGLKLTGTGINFLLSYQPQFSKK